MTRFADTQRTGIPTWTLALRIAIGGATLLLLLQAMPTVAALLEYRRGLLLHEPWRVLSGHFVHINWTHALANAVAWVLLARLFERTLDAGKQLLCIVAGAVVISLSLTLVYPSIEWYRGASGTLHALFFAATAKAMINARSQRFRLLALVALFVGGWLKVALELPRGAATPYAPWLGSATVPQAHLIGALVGTTLGLLFAGKGAARSVS